MAQAIGPIAVERNPPQQQFPSKRYRVGIYLIPFSIFAGRATAQGTEHAETKLNLTPFFRSSDPFFVEWPSLCLCRWFR